jgi:hypothetical protein
MAEETSSRSVSARGAFIIGLVLGLGLGLIFCALQTQRFTKEQFSLKSQVEILNKRSIQIQAQLLDLKEGAKVAK